MLLLNRKKQLEYKSQSRK